MNQCVELHGVAAKESHWLQEWFEDETREPGQEDQLGGSFHSPGESRAGFVGVWPVQSHRAPHLERTMLGLLLCCPRLKILNNA